LFRDQLVNDPEPMANQRTPWGSETQGFSENVEDPFFYSLKFLQNMNITSKYFGPKINFLDRGYPNDFALL
jgi:hypothetical protein